MSDKNTEHVPKDVMGRPVKVGDNVLCVNGSRSHYYFIMGIVHSTKNPNSAQVLIEGSTKPSRKQYDKLVVINGQVDANKTDYPEMFI